jgi:hypothetical protein
MAEHPADNGATADRYRAGGPSHLTGRMSRYLDPERSSLSWSGSGLLIRSPRGSTPPGSPRRPRSHGTHGQVADWSMHSAATRDDAGSIPALSSITEVVAARRPFARLAQLAERRPLKSEVRGSRPRSCSNIRPATPLVRRTRCLRVETGSIPVQAAKSVARDVRIRAYAFGSPSPRRAVNPTAMKKRGGGREVQFLGDPPSKCRVQIA